MRLELSRRAESDLADIRDYSVEQFGVERALRISTLISKCQNRMGAYLYQFLIPVLQYGCVNFPFSTEPRPPSLTGVS